MKLDLLGDRQRTHYCGELRQEHAGQTVFLAGWVDRRRDLGNLIFLDLRDHTGITQVVLNPALSAEAHAKGEEVRSEYVVGVEGEVVRRSPETVNAQLATGEVEVKASKLVLLNEARTPPFPLDDTRTSEETRLRYRYLDLRRPRLQHHLRLRHEAAQVVRQHMSAHGFVEVETPFMTRSTPEGARDYLVPSRVQPGRFYALPQSPQLFKQILMIGGLDRYFQIVRCFRDEDFRADRQAEFTQIDIEMAFPQRDALFAIIESLMEKLFVLIGVRVRRPFPQLPYDEAMEKYGSDKPHLGFELVWKRVEAPNALKEKVHVAHLKALRVPGWASASRSQLDKLQDVAKAAGADWFSYLKLGDADLQSPLSKVVGDAPVQELASSAGAAAGDLVVLLGRKSEGALHGVPLLYDMRHLDEASGEVRLDIARRLELIKPNTWSFAWIVDFPMFDFDAKAKRFAAMHHPFTSPREEDFEKLESETEVVKARAYDLVLNGSEIGGGSIRIHRRDIQQRVFSILGLTPEKARERFGFFLDALEYGTPPHGGIALGWDRIVALMCGESNIREVIAFPKTASAVDLMCDAPSPVDSPQEDELELMGAFPNLPVDAWVLARFCDELISLIERQVFESAIPGDNTFQRAMALILAKSRDDARSATRLAKAGYGPQSAGLCRAVVEASINGYYIEQDPEVRGEAYLKSIVEANRRMAKKLARHPLPDDVMAAIDETQKVWTESHWPRSVAERAYSVKNPNYDYDVVFLLLSQQLHSDVAALAGQVKLANLPALNIRYGRGPEMVKLALFTVFTYLSRTAEVSYTAFGLGKHDLQALVMRFEQAHTSGEMSARS